MSLLSQKTIDSLRTIHLIILLLAINGCQSLKYSMTNRDIGKEFKKSAIFNSQLTGFTLYDPLKKEYLCNYNDSVLYTPASNIKILTAFACLTALGDSIATYKYKRSGDSIFIAPLGDPTFLHPKFPSQKSFQFLQNKKVFIQRPQTPITRYGPGWAWDDHAYEFQKERSFMPIYANAIGVRREADSILITPEYFKNQIDIRKENKPKTHSLRDENYNLFRVWDEIDTTKMDIEIPFMFSDELLLSLLQDTLLIAPSYKKADIDTDQIFFSQSTNHVLAQMMLPSDNFLAEQLLVQCALINGFEDVDVFRMSLYLKWSNFLPDPFKWVDASGLSRYNLITPRNMVSILEQIYNKEQWETIAAIFPVGGQSGTIKHWYKAEDPYVYAKTGTLSNNHCLSGYLKTKSGKTLIFSLMNNHYLRPTAEVKEEMEKLLANIRDAY